MFQQQLSLRQHRCEDEKSGGCCDPGTVGGKLISAAQGSQPGRLFERPAFWLVLQQDLECGSPSGTANRVKA